MDPIHEEKKEFLRSSTQVELKIHEDEKKSELENTWKSGCLIMDKRATMFFTTLFISVGVMIFCIVKLCLAESCEEGNQWMALLTLVLGIWIKSPTL